MKILDRYILTSFLTTFTSVFVILFFVFILQGVWLFISDLAGKDLDFLVIVKFLTFFAPTIVPLVLPLSVLLASIMTFGGLSENYEFAAMKSSGISLRRAMISVTIFVFLLSFVAFFFANDVIPKSQYRFINLRKNIVQQKPSMAITAGQFSKVGNYTIKVAEKYGDNDNLLKDVTIHKVSNLGAGTTVVIKAASGELVGSEKSNFLQLVLFDGYYYEDIIPNNYEERNKLPFAKSSFKKYIINFDLTPLNQPELNSENISNTNTMLNVNELRYTIDSLQKGTNKDIISFSENIHVRQTVLNPYVTTQNNADTLIQDTKLPLDILSYFNASQKIQILDLAKSNALNMKYSIDSSKIDLEYKIKNINNHWLAMYDKYIIAYGCLLMFFIGAPLGAIIRKGGLGLPMVFAVLIFIIFHFMNLFGKKVAQENGITPFLGAWMSCIVLTPFAILLTYRATNDIGLFNSDVIMEPIQKLIKKFTKNKS